MPTDPMRFVTLGMTLLLLSPFAVVFWRMANFRPQSVAEYQERLEAEMSKFSHESLQPAINPTGVGIPAAQLRTVVVETVSFSNWAPIWMSFYPRWWVGLVGLLAVAIVFLATVVSLFFSAEIDITLGR